MRFREPCDFKGLSRFQELLLRNLSRFQMPCAFRFLRFPGLAFSGALRFRVVKDLKDLRDLKDPSFSKATFPFKN